MTSRLAFTMGFNLNKIRARLMLCRPGNVMPVASSRVGLALGLFTHITETTVKYNIFNLLCLDCNMAVNRSKIGAMIIFCYPRYVLPEE